MPCSLHKPYAPDCVACFTADLLTLSPDDTNLKLHVMELKARFNTLALTATADEEELCRAIIASVDRMLDGAYSGQSVKPFEIQDVHRRRYRERLRRMGTWIGFYELEVLAELYGVQFYLALPARNGRWRRYLIGSGLDNAVLIPNVALKWDTAHFELGRLKKIAGEEYDCQTERETNPFGDCGLESFLLLLFLHPGLVKPSQHQLQDRAANVLFHFKRAAKSAGNTRLSPSNDDYYLAISHLRALVEQKMSPEQVDSAIIAEGELPVGSELPSWHELMKVDAARGLLLMQPQRLSEVQVAVIDGGFDAEHPSLARSILSVDNGEEPKDSEPSLLRRSVLPDEKRKGSKLAHGTLCCGVITGTEQERAGFLGGVARSDDMGKIQVMLQLAAYKAVSGVSEDLQLCAKLISHGARVISMSYRTTGQKLSELGTGIQELTTRLKNKSKGFCFIVAAGNEGLKYRNELFVLGQHAIVVAATSVYWNGSKYVERKIKDCNSGIGVTVCAPGGGTEGKKDGELSVVSTAHGGGYGLHTNTSAACPMVAGVVALMLAVNPELTPLEVREILCLTAQKIDEENGEWTVARNRFQLSQLPPSLRDRQYSNLYGFGRVDAGAAVNEVIRRM